MVGREWKMGVQHPDQHWTKAAIGTRCRQPHTQSEPLQTARETVVPLDL